MLQPVCRRTWAPSGQTPIQRAWDRHDRLSAVAFIALSPVCHRLSLYFHLQLQNIDAYVMIWLLWLLHRRYRRQVVIVWDRLNVHRSAAAYFKKHHPTWFRFEYLPAYAPKLNPVEQCWNHTKYADLPNFIPKDIEHLSETIKSHLVQQSTNQKLLRSFFAYSKLKL
jgi:transposase